MATARQFLLFRQTKQNNKIPRLGDFLVVGVNCKCPAAVCRGQVQEAARTQWNPAVAGMTTVVKFYFFKYAVKKRTPTLWVFLLTDQFLPERFFLGLLFAFATLGRYGGTLGFCMLGVFLFCICRWRKGPQ